MLYADYEFYRDTHHGSMTEADFTKHVKSASDFIDSVTFGRITQELMQDENAAYKIRSACCECADILKGHTDRSSGITQEKVGDLTVSYAGQSSASSRRKELYGAVKSYLYGVYAGGVRLMYRGG